jgi:hypothetical protein
MLGLNDKLLKLTDESLDGNATIRIVTLVTLIYLPASFVSVSARTYQRNHSVLQSWRSDVRDRASLG